MSTLFQLNMLVMGLVVRVFQTLKANTEKTEIARLKYVQKTSSNSDRNVPFFTYIVTCIVYLFSTKCAAIIVDRTALKGHTGLFPVSSSICKW